MNELEQTLSLPEELNKMNLTKIPGSQNNSIANSRCIIKSTVFSGNLAEKRELRIVAIFLPKCLKYLAVSYLTCFQHASRNLTCHNRNR